MKKVLIAGIGNILLGDDGVGPYAVRLLDALYEFEDGVEITDLGTPALDLIYKIIGLDLLVLVDSADDGEEPGTVRCYSSEEITREPVAARMDPHSPALTESLLTAHMLGGAPLEVDLIAVTGSNYESGCILSAPVQSAVDKAIRLVLEKLTGAGVHYARREHKPDIWWSTADQNSTPGLN